MNCFYLYLIIMQHNNDDILLNFIQANFYYEFGLISAMGSVHMCLCFIIHGSFIHHFKNQREWPWKPLEFITLFFIFPSILVDKGETIIYWTIRSVLSFTKSKILLPIVILVSFNQGQNITPINDTNYYVYWKEKNGRICTWIWRYLRKSQPSIRNYFSSFHVV